MHDSDRTNSASYSLEGVVVKSGSLGKYEADLTPGDLSME
jgi:hypothetical protein